MEHVWGACSHRLGCQISNKKYQNKINVGLKRPPMDRMQSNNQSTFGGSDRLDVGDETCWLGSLWGDTVPSFGVSNGATQKIIKIQYMVAFIGCQSADQNTTTNQKQAAVTEVSSWRGWDAQCHHFGGVVSRIGGKKIK